MLFNLAQSSSRYVIITLSLLEKIRELNKFKQKLFCRDQQENDGDSLPIFSKNSSYTSFSVVFV